MHRVVEGIRKKDLGKMEKKRMWGLFYWLESQYGKRALFSEVSLIVPLLSHLSNGKLCAKTMTLHLRGDLNQNPPEETRHIPQSVFPTD